MAPVTTKGKELEGHDYFPLFWPKNDAFQAIFCFYNTEQVWMIDTFVWFNKETHSEHLNKDFWAEGPQRDAAHGE